MLDTISKNAKLKFTANLYLSPPTEGILQTQWRGGSCWCIYWCSGKDHFILET